MGPGRFGISGTVRRGRGNVVGSATSTIASGRSRAGRDEDGGGSVCHVFELLVENLGKVVGESCWVGVTKTEEVLLKAFVVAVEDFKWRGQFEETMRD